MARRISCASHLCLAVAPYNLGYAATTGNGVTVVQQSLPWVEVVHNFAKRVTGWTSLQSPKMTTNDHPSGMSPAAVELTA